MKKYSVSTVFRHEPLAEALSETGKTMQNLVGNIAKLDEHVENQSSHFTQASTSNERSITV